KRDDAAVTIQGADPNLVRKYVWLLKDKALVFVVNLTQETQTVSVQGKRPAHDLLTGRPVDLSQPLSVPALDATMVMTER
ncbi:MAG: hypothetical protein ABFD94_03965, partial [Armatimonadia bacterium]